MGKALMAVVTLALVAGAAVLLYLLLEPPELSTSPSQPRQSAAVRPAAPSPSQSGAPVAGTARTIAPDQVKRWLDTGRDFAFIDVREPDEFEKWRIPGAILVPIEPRSTFAHRLGRIVPDPSKDVVLFCRTGRRSDTAALILDGLGYQKTYNMGGIIDWNYPTEGADE